MAAAEAVYVDPSALLKLYLKEPDSRAMAAWRTRTKGQLSVTRHGRMEVANGIALAVWRGFITPAMQAAALAALEDDFAQGRYVLMDVPWRATLQRAEVLSREFTAALGCRTLDILHVASALELQSRRFLTFDQRQLQLALAANLRPVRIE